MQTAFLLSLLVLILTSSGARGEYPPGLLHPITTEHFTADGKFIAVRRPNGTVEMLTGGTRRPIMRVEAPGSLVKAVAVAPNGEMIAFQVAGGHIRFFQGHPRPLPSLSVTGEVRALSYSPDGRFLFVGRDDGSVQIVGTRNLQEVASLRGNKAAILAVAVSPDGRLLAALDRDGVLRMWELASGVEVLRTTDIPPYGRLAFDRMSRSLSHADFADCVVRRWDVRPGKLAETEMLSHLEVKPELVLKKGEKQSLRVLAHWSGGRKEDVTPACVFESVDPDRASVSPSGEVRAVAPGRAVVRVRYFGRMAACNVFVPFEGLAKPFTFKQANFIDEVTLARWKQLGLQPAGVSSDTTFLRRASLVLIGRPPTPDEVRAFLKNLDPRKRTKVIAELLDRPDRATHWIDFWLETLSVDGEKLDETQEADFRKWMRAAITDNRPLDQVVGELVRTNLGPVGRLRTPEQNARVVARAFLGVDLECSSCHPAPGQAWGRDAASGFAAIFGKKGSEPRAPGRPPLAVEPGETPRQALARWMTTDNRKTLARVFVNRVWHRVIGTPLADPSEAEHAGTLPVFPELLDALAEDFLKHGQDVKHLLLTITTSRVFMLESQPRVEGTDPLLTRRVPQRIPQTILNRILEPIAGGPVNWQGLPGQTTGESKCAYCPPEGQPPPPPILLMPSLDEKTLAQPNGVIVRMMAAGKTDAEMTEELFLLVLSRLPREEEMKTVLKHLGEAKDRRHGLIDILWALINTREFLFIS